jgi:hypothetical protein
VQSVVVQSICNESSLGSRHPTQRRTLPLVDIELVCGDAVASLARETPRGAARIQALPPRPRRAQGLMSFQDEKVRRACSADSSQAGRGRLESGATPSTQVLSVSKVDQPRRPARDGRAQVLHQPPWTCPRSMKFFAHIFLHFGTFAIPIAQQSLRAGLPGSSSLVTLATPTASSRRQTG